MTTSQACLAALCCLPFSLFKPSSTSVPEQWLKPSVSSMPAACSTILMGLHSDLLVIKWAAGLVKHTGADIVQFGCWECPAC